MPAARLDMIDAQDWYEHQAPGLGGDSSGLCVHRLAKPWRFPAKLSQAQVITVGCTRLVRARIPANASAAAIRPASASCVSIACCVTSGSKRSR